MQETRTNILAYLVKRSEDRCFLTFASVFFVKRNDFPVSGSVQYSFIQLQFLSKFYCSKRFDPIDNNFFASALNPGLVPVFFFFPEFTLWGDTSCFLRTPGLDFPRQSGRSWAEGMRGNTFSLA